jgi:hypothetical protein
MKAFILVVFILQLLRAIQITILMISKKYPRQQEFSLGYDTADFIVRLAFAFWAGIVLWM